MTARPATRLTACVGLVLALVACSGSSDSGSTPAPVTGAAPGLPPATFADLAPLFESQVRPLGLRLTRAALVNAGTRRPSPTGTHLALYVEPTSQWSDSRQVEAIVPLTRTLGPGLFARWPGLDSFDVCQEPSPGADDRPEPSPVVTVDMTREGSDAIEWDRADLVTLSVASARGSGVRLSASEAIGREPTFRSAREKAQAVVSPGG